ncbi:MAG: hypothetical protein IJU87_06060 [Lachnospiraceae bacterium]|nr:hypothetical protein [Lachnospiraceae bacterium]
MDDYMDCLVKEVEGNMKPIRAEKLSEDTGSGEEAASSAGENEGEAGKDIFSHVHRENVKCYRNTQAVVKESTDSVKQELKDGMSGIRGLLKFIILLLILNLGASAVLILHSLFGYF